MRARTVLEPSGSGAAQVPRPVAVPSYARVVTARTDGVVAVGWAGCACHQADIATMAA